MDCRPRATPYQELRVLFYRAAVPLSRRTLTHLAGIIRPHRTASGTRWRKITPGQPALLVLAHLRNGDTYARLATGFAIGTTTAWRYVRESIDLLAALADDLHAATARAARLAYAILDGTLIPIDRVADQKPYYSGCENRLAPAPGHGLTRTLAGLVCPVLDLSTMVRSGARRRWAGADVSR